MRKSTDAVNYSRAFIPLAHFAVAWANDSDLEGKNVQEWFDSFEEFQIQNSDHDEPMFFCDPPTFPRTAHARVTAWLQQIIKTPLSTTLAGELTGYVEKISGHCGITWVDELGEMVATHSYRSKPLEFAAAGALTLASASLREGFGQCEWCSRFFLETAARPGQRGRKYCPGKPCDVSARQNRFKGGTGRKGGL